MFELLFGARSRTEVERLREKYYKLVKRAEELRIVSRTKAALKLAEARRVLERIESLDQRRKSTLP